METASLPGTVKRRGKGTWDGNMCVNFGAGVLDCKSLSFGLCLWFWRGEGREMLITKTGLKQTIVGDGIWRIRRKERSSVIEAFKVEETGHGDILSDEFVNWRIKLALSSTSGGESQIS